MSGFPQVGERFGDYDIESVLGHGGMGVVFRAMQVSLPRPVALKVLDPRLAGDQEFTQRFEHEATVLAGMSSPHIIQVYGHGRIEDCLYLATQYVSGGDLGQRLATSGPVPWRQAVDILCQLLAALADAHERGVIHRDVKPSNVLLATSAGQLFAYLCDFGIAHSVDGQLTKTGMIAGSWAYMAPERHRGDPATQQSDIYSAGCVLWAMLTGLNPYSGTDVQMAMGHIGSPIPQLTMSEVAARHLNQLLHRSMAKEPADRYASATAFLADAQALAASLAAAPALITPMLLPQDIIDDRTRVRPAAPSIDIAATTLRPPQPPPVPVQVQPPAARPQPNRKVVLLAVAGAGVVAVVAGVLIALLGGRHDAVPVAAAAPASTAAVAQTAAAASEYICWNGEHNTDLAACGTPAGLDGLRYVYPSFAAEFDTCAREDPNSAERIAYACSYGGKSLIRYDYWFDGSAAKAHYEQSYKGASKTDLLAGSAPIGRLYDWKGSHKGKYRLSGNWIDNSFGFSVEAATSKQQDALISLLRFRAAADVKGYPVGGQPGVVQPQIH